MRIRSFVAALAAVLAAPVLPLTPLRGLPSATAASPTASYVPLATPTRVVDTRQPGGSILAAGAVRSVAVTGSAPLPAAGSVVAAVLNVTVTGPAGEGFWTVFPHDNPRPDASNLNIDELAAITGDAVAIPNLVTVPVGPSGLVDIYSHAGGHVIVDYLGYYTPAGTATAGRFVPLAAPSRFVDTRQPGDGPFFPTATREFRAPGAAGASAVVLNVTVVGLSPGYWTVFPAGQAVPEASNLNVRYNGHAVANQVIVPVDADGDFSVYSSGGGHIILDMIGTFTGAGAASSTDGLFVALDRPTRFLDSRSTSPAATASGPQPLRPGWSLDVPIGSHPAIGRGDVAAVVMNLTATESLAAGFVSATPAGSADPAVAWRDTSTLNPAYPGHTLPNHAIVPTSARGVNLFSERGGHLIADVAGYFIGGAAPSPYGAPTYTPAGSSGECLGFPNVAVRPFVVGSSGSSVTIAQKRLLDLGYWLAATDGNYGLTTTQAVMAFQFHEGLRPTGVINDVTAAALNNDPCRPTPGVSGTDFFEVDKSSQIAKIVRGGRVEWVVHVSTGNGQSYDEPNKKLPGGREIGVAITPVGSFRIYRVHDEAAYQGTLGTLYRPRFVVGGIAVHGAPRVPNYPASHGCIRVVNPVMDMIWARNYLPLGHRVVIHD